MACIGGRIPRHPHPAEAPAQPPSAARERHLRSAAEGLGEGVSGTSGAGGAALGRGTQSAVSRVLPGLMARLYPTHDGRQPDPATPETGDSIVFHARLTAAPVARQARADHPLRLRDRRLHADLRSLLPARRSAHRRLHRPRRGAALDRLPRLERRARAYEELVLSTSN